MNALKHVALQAAFAAGLFGLVRLAVRRREAVILLFHRFSGDGEGHPDGLPIATFSHFMAYLTRHFRVVSLAELTADLQRGNVKPWTAAVTIDDGYHEIHSLVAPVLQRYSVPASVFVVSDFIDGRIWPWSDRFEFVLDQAPAAQLVFRHRRLQHVVDLRLPASRHKARGLWGERGKRLPVSEREDLLEALAEAAGVRIPGSPPRAYRPMTWDQLRALAAQGIDVGAHTCTHPILSRLTPDRLRSEIADCKQQIEAHLGLEVRHFAYPNGGPGDYTPEAVAAVAEAGYAAAVTAVPGGNTPSTPTFELRRVPARPENLPRFAECLSGFDLLRRPSWSPPAH